MTWQKAQTFTMTKISNHDDKKMNSHFAPDRNTNEGECSVVMVLYQKNNLSIDRSDKNYLFMQHCPYKISIMAWARLAANRFILIRDSISFDLFWFSLILIRRELRFTCESKIKSNQQSKVNHSLPNHCLIRFRIKSESNWIANQAGPSPGL